MTSLKCSGRAETIARRRPGYFNSRALLMQQRCSLSPLLCPGSPSSRGFRRRLVLASLSTGSIALHEYSSRHSTLVAPSVLLVQVVRLTYLYLSSQQFSSASLLSVSWQKVRASGLFSIFPNLVLSIKCLYGLQPDWGYSYQAWLNLSRMPVDDPTTHLELTMVHEAMHLENSGKNLALVEFAHLLKMVVLFGLSAECLLGEPLALSSTTLLP